MTSPHKRDGVLLTTLGSVMRQCENRGPSPASPVFPYRTRTAYHEAGHVVFSYCALSLPIYDVSIVPDQDSLGRVRDTESAKLRPVDFSFPLMSRPTAWLVAADILSGVAAEAVLKRTRAMWLNPEFTIARNCMIGACGRIEGPTLFHTCWMKTCDYLGAPATWAGVVALANALLERDTLNHDAASRIVVDAVQLERREFAAA